MVRQSIERSPVKGWALFSPMHLPLIGRARCYAKPAVAGTVVGLDSEAFVGEEARRATQSRNGRPLAF